MNYRLLLYLKLARVDVDKVSKKGKNMKGIITWSVFARWFLTELCLCITLNFPVCYKVTRAKSSMLQRMVIDKWNSKTAVVA